MSKSKKLPTLSPQRKELLDAFKSSTASSLISTSSFDPKLIRFSPVDNQTTKDGHTYSKIHLKYSDNLSELILDPNDDFFFSFGNKSSKFGTQMSFSLIDRDSPSQSKMDYLSSVEAITSAISNYLSSCLSQEDNLLLKPGRAIELPGKMSKMSPVHYTLSANGEPLPFPDDKPILTTKTNQYTILHDTTPPCSSSLCLARPVVLFESIYFNGIAFKIQCKLLEVETKPIQSQRIKRQSLLKVSPEVNPLIEFLNEEDNE